MSTSPAGVGSCESPSGGCVALLSSGALGQGICVHRSDAETAADVFFVTEAKLLPQDTDTAFDIYDARTCTALVAVSDDPGRLPEAALEPKPVARP